MCALPSFVVVLQPGSSSAYLETLSQVREVAEKVAAVEGGSPMDERAQVMPKPWRRCLEQTGER